MKEIEKISDKGTLLAWVIRDDYSSKEAVEFLTPGELFQQAGIISRPAGYRIKNHIHKQVGRVIFGTPEAIFVRAGRIKIFIFNSSRELVETEIIEKGDIIFFTSGGHGFEFLEDSVILEIKQGPYVNQEQDKEYF